MARTLAPVSVLLLVLSFSTIHAANDFVQLKTTLDSRCESTLKGIVRDGLVGAYDAALFDNSGKWADCSGGDKAGSVNQVSFDNGQQALRFSGDATWINFPINISPSVMPQVSIDIWVKLDKVLNNRGWAVCSDNGKYDRGLFLHDDRFSSRPAMGVGYNYDSPVAPAVDKWTHYVAVWDRSAGKAYLYMNGALVDTRNANNDDNLAQFRLGGCQSWSDHSFSGFVSKLRVYSRALSAAEVSSNYRSGRCDSTLKNIIRDGLIGAYDATLFDQSGKWADCSGSNNAGTVNNVVLDNDKQALHFGDDSTSVDFPINVSPSVMPQVTFEAWINMERVANNRGWAICSDNGKYDRGLLLHDDRFGSRVAMGVGHEYSPATPNAPVAAWTHYVVVYDNTISKAFLYMNGALVDTVATDNDDSLPNLRLGGCPQWGGHFFAGWVSKFRVYNRALQASEVSANFGAVGCDKEQWSDWSACDCASSTQSRQRLSSCSENNFLCPAAQTRSCVCDRCQGFLKAVTNADGLIGLYDATMFDQSGKWADCSGKGKTGIVNAGATFDSNKQAVHFGADDAFVDFPINVSPSVMPQVTFEAWINMERVANNRGWAICSDNGKYDRGLLLHDDRFGSRVAMGVGYEYSPAAPNAPVVAWTHYVVVYDNTISKAFLYMNGALVDTVATDNDDSLPNLRLGGCQWGGHFFAGWVSKFRVYNRALQASEVSANFRGQRCDVALKGVVRDGLVGAYDAALFDQSGKWADCSGKNNAGSATNVVLDNDKQALHFTGDSTFVDFPINVSPSLMPQLTLDLTVNLEQTINNRGWVLCSDNGNYDRGLFLHDDRFSSRPAMGVGYNYGSTAATPTLGKWTQYVAVWDRNIGKATLYVDGMMVQTVDLRNDDNLPNLRLGGCQSWGGHSFGGWVSKLRVYNRALSAAEVTSNYRTCSAPVASFLETRVLLRTAKKTSRKHRKN